MRRKAADLLDTSINVETHDGEHFEEGPYYALTRTAAAAFLFKILALVQRPLAVCVSVGLEVSKNDQEFDVVTIEKDRMIFDPTLTENQISDMLTIDIEADSMLFESSGLVLENATGRSQDDDRLFMNIMFSSTHTQESRSTQGSQGTHQEEEEEEEQPRAKRKRFNNPCPAIYIALYYAFTGLRTPGRRRDKMEFVRELEQTLPGFDADKHIPGSYAIPFLRDGPGRYIYPTCMVRLWGRFQNVLYVRKPVTRSEANPEKILDITYDPYAKTWRYIYDLEGHFNRVGQIPLCKRCTYKHWKDERCMAQEFDNVIADLEGRPAAHTFEEKEEPIKETLVVYADIEAYIAHEEDSNHVMSHLAFYCPETDTYKIAQKRNVQTGEVRSSVQMVHAFINALAHTAERANKKTVIVYFHNLTGYDMHHIVAPLSYLMEEMRDEFMPDFVISKGVQKWERFDYRDVELGANYPINLKFKDSFKHVSSALSKLMDDYLKEHGRYQYGHDKIRGASKMPFPYDWYDSLDKLGEESLPGDPAAWYNMLTDQIDPRHEEAHEYWRKFECKTFNDYVMAYLKADVYGLANVMEGYREARRIASGCDPIFYHGTPSLAFYLAKRKQLRAGNYESSFGLSTPKLAAMFWSHIRGGITQAIYQKVDLRSGRDKGSLCYVDVAGLYATAMRDYYMPHGATIKQYDYRREHEDETDEEVLGRIIEEIRGEDKDLKTSRRGFCAMVEFDYEDDVTMQERDWQLPFVERRPLSGKGLVNDFNNAFQLYHGYRINWMINTLGLRVKRLGKVWEFEQGPTFKDFVSDNLKNRQEALAQGLQTLSLTYKLDNNAVYGKTMENPAKYKDVKALNDDDDTPRFASIKSDQDGDVTKFVGLFPPEWEYNHTPHIGFSILEFSKTIFYDMWFKVNAWDRRIRLLYCDTDSMILWDPNRDDLWGALTERFPGMFNADPKKKILGTWELETKDIDGVICLQAKSYYVRTKEGKDIEKHKGVSKRTRLTWDMYDEALEEIKKISVEQVQFAKKNFSVRTRVFDKVALSVQNNKRSQVHWGRESVPFGYKSTKLE